MNHIIAFIILSCVLVTTAGCNESRRLDSGAPATGADSELYPAPTVNSERGAWLGQGVFTAQQGTQQIKAQLELLADGTYRFMVIEPRVLMMAVGLETGSWQRAGQELKLTPVSDQTREGTGKLGALNRAPKNFRPKSLTVDGDAFLLKDDQMNLRFLPNQKATQKLHKRDEL